MKQSKYLNRIGCELEAGWNYERRDLHEDLGIRMSDFKNSVCCGEAITEKPLDDLDTACAWIENNYKRDKSLPWDFEKNNGLETQSMCGMHFHFSFNNIEEYVALMSTNFRKYYVEFMRKFGESYPIQQNRFWERLENKNKFCKDVHTPYEQIFVTKKTSNDTSRYTLINYCFGRYKTIEFRGMPTFVSAETATASLKAHVDCINSYLDANPPKKFDFNQEFSLTEADGIVFPDDNAEFRPDKKLPSKIKPFNLFMAKGEVPAAKYGIKELERKPSKKKSPDSELYISMDNIVFNSTPKAVKKQQLYAFNPTSYSDSTGLYSNNVDSNNHETD